MPSARKRGARSPSPPGPARAPRATDRPPPPTRRRWLAAAVLLAIVVAGAAALRYVRRSGPMADLRPVPGQNVLLITIDTLRADALSAYGGPASTPALDRLAAEGVRFTFAHAHAVLTLPSHTSILTGLYPYEHGIRENSGYRLAPGSRTLATLMKTAGYDTGAFVGAFPVHSRFGLNQGFDIYDDTFGETRAPTEFVMPERPASAVVPLARNWIAGRAGHRWFAWVHVFDPHAPYRPPPPFDREYESRPYYGEVAAADAALAPLLDDVRRSGRPTFVVVTGDHGEALGDHGEESHGLFAYESTLRVPLILAELGGGSVPGVGETSDAPARHVDILPTVLEAVGQPAPRDAPGRSLLQAAERRRNAPLRPSYFEAMSAMLNRGWAPLTGILSNRDKYIDLPIPELYDLGTDPEERTNLAGRGGDVERTLVAGLRAFGAQLPGARRAENQETLAKLRSLGYVSGDAPLKARYSEADDPKRLVDLDQAVHRGVELYDHGRFDEAEQVYREIVDRRPDMAIAYRHLAFVAWEHGKPAEAIAVLQQALQRGVKHASVVTQLGTYLAETGHVSEALRLLEPLSRGDTLDADALNSLGIAYARSGRPDEARHVFERVLAVDPESSIPLENLGLLDLARGDLANARSRFERAAQSDPNSSHARAGLGIVALKNGDHRAAVEYWKQAVQLDRTNYDALYNLATTLAGDGQFDAARPYLEQFVRTAPAAFYAKDIEEIRRLLQSRR